MAKPRAAVEIQEADADDSGKVQVIDGEASGGPRSVDDLASLLSQLDGDSRVSVTRIAPGYAEGWLDDVRVPQGQESELLTIIRKQYGGGRYRLQLRRQRPSGARVWTRGSTEVTIAGEPMLNGRRVLPDGTIETPTASIPNPTPPIFFNPPANATQGSQIELIQALAGLLRPQTATGSNPVPQPPLAEVAALIRALRPDVVPTAPDPYAGIEKTLGIIAQLKDVFASDRDPEPRSQSMFGGGSEETMLLQMLGMGQQQQQQPPPWMQHPPPGWMRPQQDQAPQTPYQAQSNPTEGHDDDDEDYEPTVDDVLEGIGALTDEQKAELFARASEVLPQEMLERLAR